MKKVFLWLERAKQMVEIKGLQESLVRPWDMSPFVRPQESDAIRVLCLGFTDERGGAAIAAGRLNESLLATDKVELLQLVSRKFGSRPYAHSTEHAHRFYAWRRIWQGIEVGNRLMSNPYGWMPMVSRYLRKVVESFRPDVIHCHNLHGGIGVLPISDFIGLSKAAPIVWTLHDMWALTGHCAYSLGCDRWEQGCGSCPDLSLYPPMLWDRTRGINTKKRMVYAKSDLTFVTPSKWLQGLVGQARATRGLPCEHIPNGIDLDLFRPHENTRIRKKLGIPENSPVVLFAAESLDGDRRKGTSELRSVLEAVSSGLSEDLHVLLIGKQEGSEHLIAGLSRIVPHHLGYFSDHSEMISYFSLADLFLCTSLMDNLPNTLLETAACGVASVTFDSGGCGEAVEDGVTGYVVPTRDVRAFAEAVLGLLHDVPHLKKMGEAARRRAEVLYSDDVMAARYLALYQDVIERRAPVK